MDPQLDHKITRNSNDDPNNGNDSASDGSSGGRAHPIALGLEILVEGAVASAPTERISRRKRKRDQKRSRRSRNKKSTARKSMKSSRQSVNTRRARRRQRRRRISRPRRSVTSKCPILISTPSWAPQRNIRMTLPPHQLPHLNGPSESFMKWRPCVKAGLLRKTKVSSAQQSSGTTR